MQPDPGTTLSLVLVPTFDGRAWDVDPFDAWHDRIVATGSLPELPTLDAYADFVAEWTVGLGPYALVGDAFGAAVAVVLAARRPARLRALVASRTLEPTELADLLDSDAPFVRSRAWLVAGMDLPALLGRVNVPTQIVGPADVDGRSEYGRRVNDFLADVENQPTGTPASLVHS